MRHRDPQRKVTKITEQVQTYRLWITLECGHRTTRTRAAGTPFSQKKVGCYEQRGVPTSTCWHCREGLCALEPGHLEHGRLR